MQPWMQYGMCWRVLFVVGNLFWERCLVVGGDWCLVVGGDWCPCQFNVDVLASVVCGWQWLWESPCTKHINQLKEGRFAHLYWKHCLLYCGVWFSICLAQKINGIRGYVFRILAQLTKLLLGTNADLAGARSLNC